MNRFLAGWARGIASKTLVTKVPAQLPFGLRFRFMILGYANFYPIFRFVPHRDFELFKMQKLRSGSRCCIIFSFIVLQAQLCQQQHWNANPKRSPEFNTGDALKPKVQQIPTHYLQRRLQSKTDAQKSQKSHNAKNRTAQYVDGGDEVGDKYVSDNGISVDGFIDDIEGECLNCIDDNIQMTNKWTMPMLKSGDKRYYLGTFFKANWYRAMQYCRYHGMNLASISNQEENDRLEKYVTEFGFGLEHFWTSGTDLAEEGSFFWMSSGRPVIFSNWNTGEPNNFRYENGEEEHCLELWNRDGKGLKWNDSPCSFETYFVCEM